MKTMLYAAAAMFALGAGGAFAGEDGQPEPNTLFTEIPGVIAQAPVQQAPSAFAASHPAGAATGTYVTSHSSGTWVFPPNPYAGGGANN